MRAYQQTLSGRRSSGRGIRYRILKPSQIDALRRKAATLVAARDDLADSEIPDMRRRTFVLEGVKAMLLAVTKKAAPPAVLPPKLEDGSQPPPLEDPLSASELWQEVDVGTLTVPGPFTYEYDDHTGEGLFTAQDDAYLAALFSVNHEINLEEADRVLKKELTVSTD